MKKSIISPQNMEICILKEVPNDRTCMNFETIGQVLNLESTSNEEE